MHPGGATKDIHLQARIIRQHPVHRLDTGSRTQMPGPGEGLDPGILGEGRTGLLRLQVQPQVLLRDHPERSTQDRPDLLHLVGVACGDEQRLHVPRLPDDSPDRRRNSRTGRTVQIELGTFSSVLPPQYFRSDIMSSVTALNAAVQEAGTFLNPLFSEIQRCVVGQKYLTERLVIGLLANGHVLLEGVPGLAKTLSVKTLATGLHVKFSRLQFTPDMLPADVVGTQIYNPQSGTFSIRRGWSL